MSGAPRVVVVGSCNIDLVASGARLPRPGETALFERLATIPGGKGANQAIAAARAGGQVALVGAVGSGEHGEQIRASLAAASVDTTLLRRVEGASGTALIMVDGAGENLIGVVPGANATLSQLTAAERELIIASAVVLLQLEIPIAGVLDAAMTACAAGVTAILNVSPAAQLPRELLAAVDVVIANQHEAQAVAATPGAAPEVAARGLLDSVPAVVVTLGAEGALYVDRTQAEVRVAPPPARAVDTTAAGDTFAGYFAVGLAERRTPADALCRACSAAAISVERMGASTSIPFRDEVEARLARAFQC